MDIPRRDVGFALTNVPENWCGNDPYRTTHLEALSLLFPEGERFFVESVKHYRHLAVGELADEVTGFIGQEAMHGREHRAFNERIGSPGIEVRLRRFLKLVRRVLSPKSQLAVTCALEHFTAMLAEQLLKDGGMRDEIDETVRPLWLWHALEEAEHKTVAFDVYRAAGGGYLRRTSMMLVTTAVFFAAHGLAHHHLMRRRGIGWKPWRWLRGIGSLYLWPGYFTRLVPAYFTYFRPGFHPSDRDTTALLAAWRDELFGEAGTLRARVA